MSNRDSSQQQNEATVKMVPAEVIPCSSSLGGSTKVPPAKKTAGQPGASKVKTQKSDKPKRPLSAYNLFFQHERDRLLRGIESPFGYSHEVNHCTLGRDPSQRADRSKRVRPPPHGKIGFAQLAKIIGARWKSTDARTKEYFDKLAVREKERYRRESEIWRSSSKRAGGCGSGEAGSAGGSQPPAPVTPNTPLALMPPFFAQTSSGNGGDSMPRLLPPPPLDYGGKQQQQQYPSYQPDHHQQKHPHHGYMPPPQHQSHCHHHHQQDYYFDRHHQQQAEQGPAYGDSYTPASFSSSEDAERAPQHQHQQQYAQHHHHHHRGNDSQPQPQRHHSWHGWNMPTAPPPAPRSVSSSAPYMYSRGGGYSRSNSYPHHMGCYYNKTNAEWRGEECSTSSATECAAPRVDQSKGNPDAAVLQKVGIVVATSERDGTTSGEAEQGNDDETEWPMRSPKSEAHPLPAPSSMSVAAPESHPPVQNPRDMLDFLNKFVCDN